MTGFVPRRDGEAPGALFGWRASPRFAVRDAPDADTPGYGEEAYPQLRVGSEGTIPDDIRIGKREAPPNAFVDIWPKPGEIDRQKRQSDERGMYTGWNVRQEDAQPAPPRVPEWTQDIPPSRPTANDSPTVSCFTRYWHIPRNVEEIYGPGSESQPGLLRRHGSLADHRRKYAIMTQVPRGKVGVNTYRKDPIPWDENLFNAPIPTTPAQGTGFNSIAGNRSFRSG